MIQLEGVAKRYRAGDQVIEALAEYTGTVEDGEFVVVTGRSGAGKSTFLSLIGGLIRPDSGRVLIDGQDIWQLSDAERSLMRCRTTGFVFQFASLIPTLTVLENVMLPTAFLPAGEAPPKQRALDLLEQVGLAGYGDRMPWQLSGGQQKRVAVARALLNRPRILLADEPTADLDEQTEQEIMALFRSLNQDGMTIVMVTHSTELASLASRHLILSGGRIHSAP